MVLCNISVTLFRTLYFVTKNLDILPTLTLTYKIHKRLIWSYLLLISYVSISLKMGITIFVNNEVSLYKDFYHIHFYASDILHLELFLVFFYFICILDKICMGNI